MKKIVSIIKVLLAVLFVQAQTITQNGVSYRYNGKNPRTPIGGVYIKPVTADNGVVSNASNGSFSVVLKNLKMGSRIGNVKVAKQGMMVFNQQAVDEWNVRKDPLCLILCDANEFQKQKKNLIAIGERQAKKKYDKKLAELKKKNEAQQLQIDDYYNKLDSLEKEYQNALKHMDEYADVFARIDESEIDTLAQRAIELFNKGEIDESIHLFEQGNYMKKLDDALHTKAQAQNLRNVADSAEALADKDIEECVKSIKAQVSAYQVKNDYEKVGELLKGMADKLQTSDAIWDYILFCKMQNKLKEEELYSYKIFQLIEKGKYQKKEILLLPLYISLGELSYNLKDFSDSENILKTALEICCRQSKDNPDLEPGLLFIYKSLGQLYQKMHRLGESEAMYKSELEVYERLSKNNPKVYDGNLADLYDNLGVLYYDLHRFSDSEAMIKSALEIRKRLAVDNPKVYEPELATSYNNLGVLYNNLQRFSDSEAMYKSALEIRKRLATDNPKAYEPELASSYNNLGILYCDIKRFSDSEAMHKSALEIQKRLAIDYPKAYEEDLASSYNNLGNLYSDNKRFNDSEAMYKSALEIRKRLATDNPKA
nr:tetratricopeptide repeat protein [uncultured Prevotella sp.]